MATTEQFFEFGNEDDSLAPAVGTLEWLVWKSRHLEEKSHRLFEQSYRLTQRSHRLTEQSQFLKEEIRLLTKANGVKKKDELRVDSPTAP